MTNPHVGFAIKPWPPVPCPIPFNPPTFRRIRKCGMLPISSRLKTQKLMEGTWHPDVKEIPSRKAPVQTESELLVLFLGTQLSFSSMCPAPRTLSHVSLALAQEFLGALFGRISFFSSLITSHSLLAPWISASLSMPHGLPYRSHKEGAPAPQVGAAWRALPKCDSPLHLCPPSHQC